MNWDEMQELRNDLQAARLDFCKKCFENPGGYSEEERESARARLRVLKDRWDRRHSK